MSKLNSPAFADAQAADTRRGIAHMCLAMACFCTNDAIVKFVSQSLPAAQLIFVRGVFASLLVLMAVQAMREMPRLPRILNRRLLLRASIDAVATMCYLTSLFHLPIGNATAINMSAPLFIILMATAVLHERVGLARWLAIAAGFAGVVMIVQPATSGFNAYAILCLFATLLHSTRDFMTRFLSAEIPLAVITLSTTLSVALLSGVLTALGPGWQPMNLTQAGLLVIAALFLAAGYFFLIGAMRAGRVSAIVPFRYTGMLFALSLGFLIWRDVPNMLALAGIVLLVGAGLFVLHGERARQQAALEAAAD